MKHLWFSSSLFEQDDRQVSARYILRLHPKQLIEPQACFVRTVHSAIGRRRSERFFLKRLFGTELHTHSAWQDCRHNQTMFVRMSAIEA